MKLAIQKTKRVIRLRLINWFVGLLAFAGTLFIIIDLVTGGSIPPETQGLARIAVVILTSVFIASFFYEYFLSNRISNALSDLARSITQVENDMAISLAGEDESYYIAAISNILNRSVLSLNEKNQKLKSEVERNQRLSENISEFYRQMKTLRETDFKFDFFEYDVEHEVFIFITGFVTLMDGKDEISEITTDELFGRFNLSISKEDFRKLVRQSLQDDAPLNFECSVSTTDRGMLWMKFWGRPCEDGTRITGAITDITREVGQRNLEKEKAIHDNITGFYNRNALSEVAYKAIADCKEGERLIFIYVGLTGYQEFEERFGMVAGNTYILSFAEVLKKFILPFMIPFRWWGSDFLLMVTGVEDIGRFAQNLKSSLSKIEKYMGEVDGIAVTFPIAIGYSVSGIDSNVPAELLEYASFAEHEALRGIRENPNPFDRDRYDEAKRASLRRTFIKDIIDKNQLGIVFQPIVSLKSGELFGFEALSRPANPMYRNIAELMDDAEASGHYAVLEKRMVYNALDSYMTRDERFRDCHLFINTAPYATLDELDYNDIRDRYFGHMKVVFEVIERNRLEPEEINLRKSIVTKAGAKFALDDFGSGYSNHMALLALEPDIIKLDRELVRGINNDIRKQHMLEDIISYARYRGTRVLAEGVETREELETLCRMGIDYAQGYFLGRPVPEIENPDSRAQDIIRAMGKSSEIGLRQVFVILLESLALVDPELSKNAAITTYLTMRMSERLKLQNGNLPGLMAVTMMHDIGALYKEGNDWRNRQNLQIPRHSLFAYLVIKEYFPCSELAEAVLYHHSRYGDKGRTINNIAVTEEAYLLSLTDDVARLVMENPGNPPDNGRMTEELKKGRHNPEYLALLGELTDEGIFERIHSGDYVNDLLNFAGCLKVGKSVVESMIRTLTYMNMFRMPFTYSHCRNMETTVSLLGRLTKQNWRLVEKVRLGALLYNLGRLTITDEEFKNFTSLEEEHNTVRERLKPIVSIMGKAGMYDMMDILNTADGNERISSENHVLMGKDVIIGARMLNVADMFASLLEVRPYRPGLNCSDAIDEVIRLVELENGYTPMVEIMGDYVEDIEGRINSYRSDIEKRYLSVISNYHKWKE